jgi:hypothetical protein
MYIGAAPALPDPLQLASYGVDLLILGSERGSGFRPDDLEMLQQNPTMKVVIISVADGEAAAFWLALFRQPLGSVSPDSLLENLQALFV